MFRSVLACCFIIVLCLAPAALAEPDWRARRQAMVDHIEQAYASAAYPVTDESVLEAMRAVPRHAFVPEIRRGRAYDDTPLSIGHGQTISQPYIVALMSQLAEVEPGMKVLEVGTGSGYQAAVLAEIGAVVYSVEIITPLAERAGEWLEAAGFDAVTAAERDGYYGWPEYAPFDRIVVTAAADHIPQPLVQQLKAGGRMVIPVGPRWGMQELMLVEKDDSGDTRTRSLVPVRFVPLTGGPE